MLDKRNEESSEIGKDSVDDVVRVANTKTSSRNDGTKNCDILTLTDIGKEPTSIPDNVRMHKVEIY